jgi:formylmethanofuran dehydrogenase subunit B
MAKHQHPGDNASDRHVTEEAVALESTIVADAVCTRCGCVCDDIDLSVADGRIVAAERACALGEAWFLRDRGGDHAPATIAGQAVALDDAVDEAARILAAARYPLIYGLSDTSCEAQRVAVSIGDWIGACVDTTTSIHHGPSGLAFSGVCEVTCSLGEVRHRGNLVIFWGSNPAESHPRHAERYSLDPEGIFVPGGRADRTCVVVDVRETESARQADLFLRISPGCDFEALWILRALVKEFAVDAAAVEETTGVSLPAWQDLANHMKRARFGVIFYGAGLTMTRGGYVNSEAVLALARDMNAFTRFVCLPMRGKGNVAGADSVLLWTTGYPFGVNFSRGYPRYNPGEFTAADVLARSEVDAALVIASDPMSDFSSRARKHLASIPYVCMDADETVTARAARVAFRTATYGINTAGAVYRMDDVPLPLRPAVTSTYPSDVDVLERIEARVKQLRGYGAAVLVKERTRLV